MFISYRRADDRYAAGWLHDRLSALFGAVSVFFDVDSIPAGANFREVVRDRLVEVDVVLVLVGKDWGTQRLWERTDLVRSEVELALDQDKIVIPVLFADASMPSASDLPAELAPFADRQAVPVRPDPDFRRDFQVLIDEIANALVARGAELELAEAAARERQDRDDLKAEQARHEHSLALQANIKEVAMRRGPIKLRTGDPVGDNEPAAETRTARVDRDAP